MHVTRSMQLEGSGEDAIRQVLTTMQQLRFDIVAVSSMWVKAKSGDWWEKKVDVEVLLSSEKPPTITIDAEPISALPVGPAWQNACQEAVDELARGLAPSAAKLLDNSVVEVRTGSLTKSNYNDDEWRELVRQTKERDPYPYEATKTQTLAMRRDMEGGGGSGGGGGAVGGGAIGAAFTYVADKAASGIIEGLSWLAVQTGLKNDDSKRGKGKKAKIEYDPRTHQTVIRHPDGRTTVAPQQWQPR